MTENNTTTTIAELLELSDEDYTNTLKANMRNSDDFAVFLREELVDRTNIRLGALSGVIGAQLEGRLDPDPDWARRARGFVKAINARKSEAKSIVKELNREETASVHAVSMKWSGLALQLAEALDASGNRAALDSIAIDNGPGTDSTITAADWLDIRRDMKAKRATKTFAEDLGLAA